MAKIFVDINGDASDFLDEAKRAEAASERLASEFAGMGKAADKAGADLNDLGRQTSKFGNATKPLTKSIQETNAALKQLQPGSNQAGNALQNLGRIAQDAPFGFIGISNNINPLLESFQRLKAETGTTGGALKALGGQLMGAGGIGLAVSVVTGLLVVFGDALFGSKKKTDEADAALKAYNQTLEDSKNRIDGLVSSVQFANKLGAINVKIFGFGKETGNELQDLREQSVALIDLLPKLQAEVDTLFASYTNVRATGLKGDKLVQAEESALKAYQQANEKLSDTFKEQGIIFRQIEFQKLSDQAKADDKAKAARDKALQDNAKYVSDTITEAKKLADYLNKATNRQFDTGISDDPRQALQEQFNNAVEFLQRAALNQRGFALKLNAFPQVTLDVTNAEFLKEMNVEGAKVVKALADAIAKLPKQKILVDFEAELKNQKATGDRLRDAVFGQDQYAGLPEIYSESLKAADAINGVLTPAFQDLFGAIVAGENPLKAFFQSIGQSIQQLIQKLIAAAIQALILSAILPGGGAALGGFSGIFKGLIGARANGGSVLAGRGYIVGERGPEYFQPAGNGRIVPNGDLNSGLQGIAGSGRQVVTVVGKIRGKDIILSNAREGSAQNRLV